LTDLAPVQLEAITRANGRRGFAYYMEMGLGKTLTVLTEFKTLRMCGAVEKLVVICPNSFKGGWDSEIMKHRTGLSAMVYESTRKCVPSSRIDVLVINYEAVRTAKGLDLIKEFTYGRTCYLALDESIKLKNRNSKQTQAIIGKLYKGKQRGGITSLFSYVRLLSGKPMTQGPHDLWPQLVAIDQMSMSFYGFQARFCRLGGWQDRQVVGVLNEEELQEGLAKVSFQAKKRDWLKGLPPKVYSTRRYELTGALLRHYEEMREDFLTYLRSEVVSVQIAVTKYEKLAQIMCGFIIKEGGEVEQLVEAEHNPRLTLLQEILDEEVSGKAVVVYRHKHAGVMLSKHLGHSVAWIHGGMTPAEIDAEKWLFDRPHSRIMLLQADAGKYGHTLVGTPDDPCGTMLFFENTYSLDTRSQIEDRIHRMGAVAESCLYVDLSGSDLDQRIVRALQRKENMFKAVFPQFQETSECSRDHGRSSLLGQENTL
jgi:Mesyanzhinovviridae DNA helicase